MEKVKLFLQDSYVDFQTDIIDKYMTGVSENLKNNPCFLRVMNQAISFLTRKYRLEDRIPPIELSVFEDGSGFELAGGIRKNPDCMNDALSDNKCFEKVRINLSGKDNDMEYTTSSGTLFNFDEYQKECEGTELGDKLRGMNSSQTPTVLSVMHRNVMFTDSGIEVANSSFSDEYPLGIMMNNEDELRVQTSLHAPTKWNFNLLPNDAPYEFNPSKSNAHRFLNSLGIIHVSLSKGRKLEAKSEYADYPANTEYPEVLSTNPAPFRKYNSGKLEVTPQYKEYFPEMDDKEIEKQIEMSFASGLEGSKTKEYFPVVYDALKKIVDENLEKKYGVQQQEEETQGMRM